MNIFQRIYILCSTWWNLTLVLFQMMYGAWKISRLADPIVTIFGGSRIDQHNKYARQAHELGHALIKDDISVITGGGPGIMRAASCGASHEMRKAIKARSIGISVQGLEGEAASNDCDTDYFVMRQFFSRKWLMINYSVAFAVFPGGFGTLDELAEILTLIQTKKLSGSPVVLIGVNYWKPFVDWLHDTVLQQGLITQEELGLFKVTDDLDHARFLLKEHCKLCVNSSKK